MSSTKSIDDFRQLKGSELVSHLQDLGLRARNGDSDAMLLLTDMLKDGYQREYWLSRGAYVSGAVHTVSNLRNMKAMQLILDLVRNLPEGVPAGAIELLAGILVGFYHFTKATLREWIQREDNSPAYLVGIQAMCNLYIEGYLQDSDIDFLKNHLQSFEIGDYITRHVVELVRGDLESRQAFDEDTAYKMLTGLIG